MNIRRIRTAIEQAVDTSVQGIQVDGIDHADLKQVTLPSEQVKFVAAQIDEHGHCEISLTADVQLFLRISNDDLLIWTEPAEFLVRLDAEQGGISAVANSRKNWPLAWEHGMEPIRGGVLQDIRRDIRKIDETLTEDSTTFQAAMVLFASEMVGPYVDRVATFVGYPQDLVQVIADRLQKAEIWRGHTVHCEPWFDPRGGGAFVLDLLVAEGQLLRAWSEERQDYVYSWNPNGAESRCGFTESEDSLTGS